MKRFLLIALCMCQISVNAQDRFDKQYFKSPLDIPLSLAGNFGECRPNHFHTGLDFKTNQQENLPVYAAADGYIDRMVISHTGYGHTLYITHPNGLQTVYAHLNDFNPALMAYLKAAQYKLEQWQVDLTIPEGTFPVKQGDFIAYSGNTGGSMAPHLHFEIRIANTDTVLNAAQFSFDIKDTKAPIIKSIAIYNAALSIYNQSPIIATVQYQQGKYVLTKPIQVPYNTVKIGVYTDDMMEGSTNVLGIYSMELRNKGAVIFKSTLEKLTFGQNRYMNAYGDFRRFKEKGIWYQSLFKLPNNALAVYDDSNSGIINLENGTNTISLKIADVYGNVSALDIPMISESQNSDMMRCSAPAAWQSGIITLENVQFTFAPGWMYDDYCWEVQSLKGNNYGASVQLAHNYVPIHDYGNLKLKLNNPIPFHLRSKIIFQYQAKADKLPGGNAQSGIAAQFENGWASARIRNLGYYAVGIDTIAPSISIAFKPNQRLQKGQLIQFTVKESQTSIQSCKAYINDKWVCFQRKGNTFSYKIEDNLSAGTHVLKVVASDESLNIATKSIPFSI